jgi:hypothetical protein
LSNTGMRGRRTNPASSEKLANKPYNGDNYKMAQPNLLCKPPFGSVRKM